MAPDVAARTAVFLGAHIPLGFFALAYPQWVVLHAFAVAAAGLAVAAFGVRTPHRVAYVAAYAVSSEVLWRMAGAQVGWEFAKYVTLAAMLLWMAQRGLRGGPWLVLLYVALLLPSTLLTLQEEELELARQLVTFNLIGPLCLTVSVWFFSQIRLTPAQRRNLYLAAIAPAVAIATIVFRSTILNPDITFGSESNVQAAGGFGPNQVSMALGLAGLLALLAMIEHAGDVALKPLMSACVVVLFAMSALTLSRGGLIAAFSAMAVGALFLLWDPRARVRMLVVVGVLGIAGYYAIFPAADRFTSGALSSRFADTGLTNRDAIVRADLQIWQEHLWFGVGPGRGNEYREAYIRNTAAHTEYTRMLAEHGLLGLLALVALAALLVDVVRRPRAIRDTASVAALITWSALFMLSYGMRLAAPAFIIGLACMPTSTQTEKQSANEPRRRLSRPLSSRRGRAI
jgi:O-antigen ligase